MNETTPTTIEAKPKTGWLNILVDYGPLLVFLGVYKFYAPDDPGPLGEIAAVIYGTIAFMIAAVVALSPSLILPLGKIRRLLVEFTSRYSITPSTIR